MSASLEEKEKELENNPVAPQDDRSSIQERDNDPPDTVTHEGDALEVQSIAGSQLPPPPDGGLHAWLKVVGGFLIYINIW